MNFQCQVVAFDNKLAFTHQNLAPCFSKVYFIVSGHTEDSGNGFLWGRKNRRYSGHV